MNEDIAAERGLSALATAGKFTKAGYRVVPIPYRQKRPIENDWPNLVLTMEQLPARFKGPCNVGLILGTGPGGSAVVDIDLDTPEAMQAWNSYAPPTSCIFGRASKRASHHLYLLSARILSQAFVDPLDSKTIMEFRCCTRGAKDPETGELGPLKTGHQTILPGSVHKDTSEPIEYELGHNGEPSRVSTEFLQTQVRRAAAAAMLARHWPAHGRHQTELALAGTLLRGGWDEAQTRAFVLAAYTAVRDHDTSALGRVAKAVEDTARKLHDGNDVTGQPRLEQFVDPKVVKRAMDWLGIGMEVPADWTDLLVRSKKGTPLGKEVNVLIALRNSPAWQGVIAFNELRQKPMLMKAPPWSSSAKVPIPWQDPEDTEAAGWMQANEINASSAVVAACVTTVAIEHSFNPVRNYLMPLKHDRIARVHGWLSTYLGAEDNPYTRAVAARMLISAVARALNPGCKVDTVLILEGAQGCGKSTCVKILGGEFYVDGIPLDLNAKDTKQIVSGAWFVEFAEMAAITHSRAEATAIKQFVTTSTDVYRSAYLRREKEYPRPGIFVGTTNESEYLRDSTGARRFWPVKVRQLDKAALERDRDQLFAEAKALFDAGHPWWLETRELETLAKVEQDARFVQHPWQEQVQRYLEGKIRANQDATAEVSMEELFEHLQIPPERRNHQYRTILGGILTRLGWQRRRHHGDIIRYEEPTTA